MSEEREFVGQGPRPHGFAIDLIGIVAAMDIYGSIMDTNL
jgi:hypothetical protein